VDALQVNKGRQVSGPSLPQAPACSAMTLASAMLQNPVEIKEIVRIASLFHRGTMVESTSSLFLLAGARTFVAILGEDWTNPFPEKLNLRGAWFFSPRTLREKQ
jgi:hypothetical protein